MSMNHALCVSFFIKVQIINMKHLHVPSSRMRQKTFKANIENIKWYLTECLDIIWKGIYSIWRILIIGGIVVGIIGNAAYEYLTKGYLEFANLTSLPSVQLVETYPVITVCLILGP